MIKVGDIVQVVDLSVLPAGNYITCNNEFRVGNIQGENVYIANDDMSIFLPIKALEKVDKSKVEENKKIYFAGDKIEIKNKNNSTAIIYNSRLGSLKTIRVDLKIKNICLTQHISNLEDVNKYLQGIGFEVELKYPETVAEITEEMKNKAKPFVAGKENYIVVINNKIKKISRGSFGRVEVIGALYFDYDVAKDIAERLQAAYDREGWE